MDTKMILKIVAICLYFICSILTGVCSGLQFRIDQKGCGLLYSIASAGFLTCAILELVDFAK